MKNFEFSWYSLKKGFGILHLPKKDGNISFDPGTNAGIFKDFYSNLASNLVKQLPTATFKYGMDYVINYYKTLIFLMGLLVSHM